MATNLMIAYPAIPFLATTTTLTTGTLGSGSTLRDLETGARSNYVNINSAVVGPDDIFKVTYDLGSGNTSTSDYLIVARADLILAQGATIRVEHETSTDNVTYAQRENVTPLSSSHLFGPESEDLLITTGGGTSTRYHRFVIADTSGGGSFSCNISKVYVGPKFDFGVDPVYPRRLERDVRGDNDRRARYRFSLTWRGVTDSIRNSFIDKILKYRDISPVFLYTTSYHDVLNEHRLLHCSIKSANIDPRIPNKNDISVSFEELI